MYLAHPEFDSTYYLARINSVPGDELATLTPIPVEPYCEINSRKEINIFRNLF